MTEAPTMSDTPAVKLTKAEADGLLTLQNDVGGIAGSEWYPAEWIGGRTVARALNKMGLARMMRDFGAGIPYAITNEGRALLDALKEEGEA